MTRSTPAGWDLERDAIAHGATCVAGIDEAGRGAWAGPVAAACVVLPLGVDLPGLTDSKQLTPSRRAELELRIEDCAVAIGFALASQAEIDRLNILRATHLAMRRSFEIVRSLAPEAFGLIDGLPVPGFPAPCRSVVRGDCLSASIAAASVIAKVRRDRIMVDLQGRYGRFAFARHKGYGTQLHRSELQQFGPCPEHRLSYRPVVEASMAVMGRLHGG
ncbi:MAG: ribonuclease HII [Armatimonadetes bacterium]|nr:ribonuclease HII [Armatimonadota bacterium]MDE2205325.1 ribonuclease HII [Armatimonadota bacterium]